MNTGGSVVPTLARRFLLSKASDGFLSMISLVSVVGVALGVLALVVVTSVINGFEGELVRVITGMNGDVLLYSRGDPLSQPAKVIEKIQSNLPEQIAITQSFVTEIMASGPNGVAGAVVEGVDQATLGQVTEIPRRVVEGTMPGDQVDSVAIGQSLAERIGAKVGGEIRLIAPFAGARAEGANPDSAAPKVLNVKVSGIVKMGMHEYDSKFIFARLPDVQRFLDYPGNVTSFKIKLRAGTNSREAADRLSEGFGYPFRAKDWSQMNKNLLYAIQLEKVVIAIILTVIVIVAAFNVVSTLMMMIHDKSKEIAILKAMGFRPGQGFRLFNLIGTGIGAVGALIGILVGLLLNAILERTRLVNLPADIYYIGYLPVVVRWGEIAMIGGVALVITFLATVYPAYKVSTRPPLEGIRYE